MLPDRGWQSYEDALRRVGENRPAAKGDDPLRAFLTRLGLLGEDRRSLTEDGEAYFKARFISGDHASADDALHRLVLDYPPATALTQLLAGVAGADRARAETVLRSQGFDVTDRTLGSLLKLMDRAGVAEYNARTSAVRVLDSPATAPADAVPHSVYVSPATPYGNKVWLRRVLAECTGSIDWLDKHFMPIAFEALWEAVDGASVSRVRVLSLRLKEHDEGKRTIRQYRDLRRELAGRGVDLSWRTIDSTKIRDTHDRWIIGDDTARNVPNVNAIYTGQHSEMNLSAQHAELRRLYNGYWDDAVPFDPAETP